MGWNPRVRKYGLGRMVSRGVTLSQHRNTGRKLVRKDNSRHIMKPIGNKGNLHLFKRTLIVPVVLNRATASQDVATGHNIWGYCNSAIAGQEDFRLSSLDGYTDFTNLFDRYKINGIKWELSCFNGEADMGNASAWVADLKTTSGTIKVHTCNDYDDNTPIGSIKEMAQYSTYKRTSLQGQKQVKRYIRPRVLAMAYETAVSTAYSPKVMYIDCNDSATPHYGIKFIVEEPRQWQAGQDASYLQLQLKCTFFVSFKDPR